MSREVQAHRVAQRHRIALGVCICPDGPCLDRGDGWSHSDSQPWCAWLAHEVMCTGGILQAWGDASEPFKGTEWPRLRNSSQGDSVLSCLGTPMAAG